MENAPLYNDLAEGPEQGQAYWLKARDGVRLRIAVWSKGTRGTVLMFPGRTEYIEKYGRTASELAARGYAMAAIDWRGQGLSDRLLPDRLLGHVGHFRDYQMDVEALMRAGEVLRLPMPWFLLGHSMGGAIGLRSLHLKLRVKAAAFSAPMWGFRLTPAMRPVAVALGAGTRLIGGATLKAPGTRKKVYTTAVPFKDNALTTDADSYAYMDRQTTEKPDLAISAPTIHWAYEAMIETRDLRRTVPPNYPVLTGLGSNERIVDPQAVRQVMARWKGGTLDEIIGAEHEILMEKPSLRGPFLDKAAALFAAHT